MGVLGYLTIALSVVWVAAEFRVIDRKRSDKPSQERDRNSLRILLLVNYGSVALALVARFAFHFTRDLGSIAALSPYIGYFGCLLIALGLLVRWRAIATLGQQFTVDVSIVENHQIVESGLYRTIRHPSYLGSLLSFIGLGFALENWISLLILFILPVAATMYRILVEERALVDHFGAAYRDYMDRTKRLIPRVF